MEKGQRPDENHVSSTSGSRSHCCPPHWGQTVGADLATTGVAGPDPQDGHPVGTVYVAVATPETAIVSALTLSGTRDEIRTRSVQGVLELALTVV